MLAMNLAMLIGFALTGLATYALVHAWTRDPLAGIAVGSLFAFNMHTLTRRRRTGGAAKPPRRSRSRPSARTSN